jgi:hypothetical protein
LEDVVVYSAQEEPVAHKVLQAVLAVFGSLAPDPTHSAEETACIEAVYTQALLASDHVAVQVGTVLVAASVLVSL